MKKGKLLLVTLLMATVSSASLLFAACEPENGHTHTFGEWTIQTAPTESTPGKAERNCVAGDGSEELDLPALTDEEFWAHTNTPATHSADGADTYVNAEHGITYTKPITALGHVWGAWQFVEGQTPTRTAGGKAERKCEDFATDAGREEKILPELTDSSFWTETITQPASPTEAGKANYSNSEYGLTVNDVEIPATAEPAQQVTFTVKTDSEAAGQSLTLEVGASLKAALDALLEDVSKPGMHFVKWTIEGGVDVGAQDIVSAALSGKTITGVWEDDADYAGAYYGREFEGLGSAQSTDLATLTIDESGAVTFTVAGDGNASMAFSGSVEGYDAASQIISVSGGKYIFFDSVSGLIAVNADPSQNKIGAHFVLLSKEATADNGASLGTFHVGLKSQPAGEAAADYYTHFVVVDGEAVLIHENKIYTGLTLTDGYGDALAAFTGAAATWSADVETIVAKTADGDEVLAVYAKNGDSPSTFQYGVCAPLDAYHGSYTVESDKVQLDGAGRIKYTKGGTPYEGTYKVESDKDYTLLATITDEVPEGDPTIYKVTVAGDSLTIAAAQTVIHFNMGIGTGSIGDKTVNTGSKVYLEAAENEADKIFVGWYTDSGLSEGSKLPTDEQDSKTVYVIENIQGDEYTVYAKWEESILITLDANGGNFDGSADTITVKVAKGASLAGEYDLAELEGYKQPTNAGKVFAGWFETSEDTLFAGKEEINAAFTLKAKWVDAEYYMKTYVFAQFDGPRSDNYTTYTARTVSPRLSELSTLDFSRGKVTTNTFKGFSVSVSPFNGECTISVSGSEVTITVKIDHGDDVKTYTYKGFIDPSTGVMVLDVSNKEQGDPEWGSVVFLTPFEEVEYYVKQVADTDDDGETGTYTEQGAAHNSLYSDHYPAPEQIANKRLFASAWTVDNKPVYAISYKTSDGHTHNVYIADGKAQFDVTFADLAGTELKADSESEQDKIHNAATLVIKQSEEVVATYGYNGSTLVKTDGLEGIYTHDPSDENEDLGQLTITGVSGYMGGAILGSETCKYSVDDPSGKIVIVTKQDDSFYKITLNTENDTYTYEKGKLTITLNLNDKTANEEDFPASVEADLGQPVEIPVPTTAGFIFGGWYTTASGSTKVESIGGNWYVFDKATTLYAKWLTARTFTVDMNGEGENVVTTLADKAVMAPAYPTPVNGKSFNGFYTDKACSAGKEWKNYGGAISSDTTIYVKWKEGTPLTDDWTGVELGNNSVGKVAKVSIDALGAGTYIYDSSKTTITKTIYDPITRRLTLVTDANTYVYGVMSADGDAAVLASSATSSADFSIGWDYRIIFNNKYLADSYSYVFSKLNGTMVYWNADGKTGNEARYFDMLSYGGKLDMSVLYYNNALYTHVTAKDGSSNLTSTQASSKSKFEVYGQDGALLYTITGSSQTRTASDGLNATYALNKNSLGENLGEITVDGSGKLTVSGKDNGMYMRAGVNESYTVGAYFGSPVSEFYKLTLDTVGHTYYAEKPMAKITYSVQGGTLTHDADNVNVNVPFELPTLSSGDTATNGWFYDEDCTKPVALNAEGKYVPTADVTLYSKAVTQYTVTIDYAGHVDGGNVTFKVFSGSKVGDLSKYEVESNDGTAFVGWYKDSGYETEWDDSEITSATTIYAKYEASAQDFTIEVTGSANYDWKETPVGSGTWKSSYSDGKESTIIITFNKAGTFTFDYKKNIDSGVWSGVYGAYNNPDPYRHAGLITTSTSSGTITQAVVAGDKIYILAHWDTDESSSFYAQISNLKLS